MELNEDKMSETGIAITSKADAAAVAVTPDQVLPPFPVAPPVEPTVNIYRQEFLNLQNELMNDETEQLQRDNEERKRMFNEVNEDWSDNFLDRDY